MEFGDRCRALAVGFADFGSCALGVEDMGT